MSQLRPRRLTSGIASFCAAALLGGLLFPTAASAAEDPLPAAAEEPRAAAEKPGPGDTEPLPVAPDAGLERDDVPASGRYVVKFKEKAGRSSAGRSHAYGKTAKDLGIAVKEVRTTATGAQVIETAATLDSTASQDLVSGLEANPDVAYVEPDPLLQPAAAAPNDPLYKLQWNFWEERAGLRVPGAWAASRGEGAVVAVVDTGITNHSDLNANVLPGYDMISDPTMSRDGNGRDPDARDAGDWYGAYECGGNSGGAGSSWHGTHVAGIVAAVTGNGKGVAGVAPGAKVLPVRALGACGGYMSDIADGIIWAAGGTVPGVPANPNPADVVNMSLGGSGTCSYTSQAAIDYAYNAGAAVVVAAGNENRDALNANPANCEHVITVAASGREGNRAAYSNFGSVVDITAPGGDMSTAATSGGIASTLNDGATTPGAESYYYSQGTSMAAPHVAGVAALMIAGSGGTMTPAAVEQRLKDSARPLPGTCTQGCGAGLVDAAAAVGSAPSPTPEPPVVEVVPKDVVFTDKDGTAADTYTVPSVEGVSYQANGEPVAAGSHPGSGTVVVTATAQPGYTLQQGSTTKWSHAFSAAAIKVDTAAPAVAGSTVTPESLNLADGTDTVTVKVQLTDATGAVAPSVSLDHAETDETVGFGAMKLVSGDVKNGTWERAMTLPEGASAGTWDVTLYPLRDTLGNSSADFRNLGSIEVAAEAAPEASPSITSQGEIVAFDSHGQLWNYGHSGTGSTRVLIGASGWTIMDEIHTVDWKADGYIDIIAQSKSGKLYYYQAKRDGGFTRHTIGSSGWAPYDLTVTKWRTGDKYPVVIAKNSSTGRLYVYPNDSGTWLSPRYVLGSSGWTDYTLTAMDWDRDGQKDVVAKTPAGQLKLYRGNGSGKFISETRRIVGSSGWNSMSNIVTSNGYAGEGTAGLIARGSDGKLWYYQANKGSWAERELIGTGWSSYTVAAQ